MLSNCNTRETNQTHAQCGCMPCCIFYKQHRRLESERTAIFVSFEQEWGQNQLVSLVECESLRSKVVSIDKSGFD